MKVFVIISSFLLLLLLLASWTNGSGIFESLEEFLDNEVISNTLPKSQAVGLGVTVTSGNGSFLYSKGFGFRDIEENDPATNKHLFAIASITKSFTAILTVKILNEKFPQFGETVLDIPINTLDPTLNVTLSDRYRTESVSFKDLLAHRMCLTSHLRGGGFGAIKDAEEFLYRSRYESEVCPFRSTFLYNDAMYNVAGRLVAKIGGDSYDNLMRKLLDDLGMTDSRLLNLDEDYDTLNTLMQSYYVDGEGTLKKGTANFLKQIALDAPDGALLSTTDDMAKYIHFHLNVGKSIVGGVQVVPEEVMAWLTHPVILVDDGMNYGLGLFLSNTPSHHPLISHSGWVPPFSSLLCIIPALNIGFFLSSNGPGSTTPWAAHDEFQRRVIDFLSSQRQGHHKDQITTDRKYSLPNPTDRIISGSPFNDPKKPKTGQGPLCNVSDVVGTFGHAVEGELEINVDPDDEGGLKLKYGIWGLGHLDRIEGEDCKFKVEINTVAVINDYSMMDGGVIVNIVQFQWSEVTNGWDLVVWEAEESSFTTYRRNLSLENLPQIPYDDDSCVAEISYD